MGAIIKQVVKCSLQSTFVSASTLQNMGRTVHFPLSWYQLHRGRNIHLTSKDRPGQDLGGVTSRSQGWESTVRDGAARETGTNSPGLTSVNCEVSVCSLKVLESAQISVDYLAFSTVQHSPRRDTHSIGPPLMDDFQHGTRPDRSWTNLTHLHGPSTGILQVFVKKKSVVSVILTSYEATLLLVYNHDRR
jgi:hypothetical protein